MNKRKKCLKMDNHDHSLGIINIENNQRLFNLRTIRIY